MSWKLISQYSLPQRSFSPASISYLHTRSHTHASSLGSCAWLSTNHTPARISCPEFRFTPSHRTHDSIYRQNGPHQSSRSMSQPCRPCTPRTLPRAPAIHVLAATNSASRIRPGTPNRWHPTAHSPLPRNREHGHMLDCSRVCCSCPVLSLRTTQREEAITRSLSCPFASSAKQ
jgi:hypothetical protein